MLASKRLTFQWGKHFTPRYFATHGHGVASHSETTRANSVNSEYALHTEEYLESQAPKKGLLSERFMRWMRKYWAPNEDDILTNDHAHKFALYKWMNSTPIGSKGIVKFLSAVFERT